MDLEIAGKTALITGASKGIGLAVAKGLAAEGCNVHLTSRTAADLETAKGIIEQAHGVEVSTHALDLSVQGNVAILAEAVGEVDILINNAGAIPGGDVASIEEAQWREAWDLKVFGYINMTRHYLGQMTARGNGVIVNVIGLAGEKPAANYVAGSAGNASLMAFTRAIGGASLDQGVRVLAVNPGPVETDRITTLLKARAEAEFDDVSRWREFTKVWPMDGPRKQRNAPIWWSSRPPPGPVISRVWC